MKTTPAPLPFDLIPGGPTFRLLLRVGLANPAAPRLVRTALVLLVVTWVPIALLSLVAGTAFVTEIDRPFSREFALHARLLLAIPLLVLFEVTIGPRLRAVAATFIRSGLVRESDYGSYETAVRDSLRLRDSTVAEVVLIALAVVGTVLAVQAKLAALGESWAVTLDGDVPRLSAAGWWYALAGLPIFQFLVLRSLWRGYIWTRFLGAMSRLDLALVGTHPDRAAGLGFVGVGQTGWSAFALAISIVLAGSFADAVIYGGRHVLDFKLPIAGFGAIVALCAFGPLLKFRGQLARTRFAALLEYGALVHTHHLEFDRKWIGGREARDESLLGNPDASSLADMSAGYDGVVAMRGLPVGAREVVPLAIAVALPMIPLFAIEIPISEILKKLLAIVA